MIVLLAVGGRVRPRAGEPGEGQEGPQGSLPPSQPSHSPSPTPSCLFCRGLGEARLLLGVATLFARGICSIVPKMVPQMPGKRRGQKWDLNTEKLSSAPGPGHSLGFRIQGGRSSMNVLPVGSH